MRCLLILRMQRRVELLLLRSLCILMDLLVSTECCDS